MDRKGKGQILKNIKDVLQTNREFINSPLKRDYLFLYEVLMARKGKLKKYTQEIYKQFNNHSFAYRNRIACHITTKSLKEKGLHNGNRAINRHINYLCLIGIFEKLDETKQAPSKINRNFKKENPGKESMNQLFLVELTDSNLKRINNLVQAFNEMGITPGNISATRIEFNGMDSKELYFRAMNKGAEKKAKEKKAIKEFVLDMVKSYIESEGYITKAKILSIMDSEYTMSKSEIMKTWSLISPELKEKYHFHKPTESEKERFNISSNKFIYTSLKSPDELNGGFRGLEHNKRKKRKLIKWKKKENT